MPLVQLILVNEIEQGAIILSLVHEFVHAFICSPVLLIIRF